MKRFPILFKRTGDWENLPLCRDPFIEGDKRSNHFLWDGEVLSWVDREAGHLLIDFNAPQLKWRFQRINRAQEPLLRALDWKSNDPKTVWDLTAGLGRDSLLLAHAGFEVVMHERNPILQQLLRLALEQFRKESEVGARLSLSSIDSLEAVKGGRELPQLFYLDPMYPERKKSALVKKELRIIRHLVGDDPDSNTLLETLLDLEQYRIAVKRPQGAPYLGEIEPHHSIEAPNTRFDVYLKQK